MREIIGVLFLFIVGIVSCNFAEKEKYLLPDGFQGNVVIISGIGKGAPNRYEGRMRVYDIPVSGVFITQFAKDYGITDRAFYYKGGERVSRISSVSFQDSKSNLDSNKIYAFYGMGYNISHENPKNKIGVEIITVCKVGEYNSYINENFIQHILASKISFGNISYGRLLAKKDSLNGIK